MSATRRAGEEAGGESDAALRRAYRELFLLSGWMREGYVGGPRAAPVRLFIEDSLKVQRRELLRAGLDEELVAEAQLAVIALLDESANGSPVRDFAEGWQRETLQYAYYSHNNLGRDFFERLDERRSRPDAPVSLLEHYARCLAWGFEGRYRQENRLGDLRVLRETLHNDLQRRLGPPPPLSAPIAELAKLAPPPVIIGAPWVLGIGAGLILLCGLVLSLLLYWQAGDTVHILGTPELSESGEPSAGSPVSGRNH